MTEWVIGDTHFNHANIIKYCKRPFKDVIHMNEELIRKWNVVVAPEDIVYHVGDVGMSAREGASHELPAIMSRLNGTKILTLGNHDKGAQTMREIGFAAVLESVIVCVPRARVMLTHYPVQEKTKDIDFVVHGHIHNATREDLIAAGESPNIPDFNINVSVEVINYQPVSLHALIKHKLNNR